MSGKRKRESQTIIPEVHEEKKLKNDQTVHEEKKPPRSSNGHNAKTPTCQEIDLTVDHDKTKDKNSSNDHIKPLITIKLLTYTYCEDTRNIDFFKTLKDVENHILRCNAPYMQARKSSRWRSNNSNKEIEFVDDHYTSLFYWICPQEFRRQPIDYSTAFFQCSRCPGLEHFQNKDMKTLIKHQKDDHNIEYSAEFLSGPENNNDNEVEYSGWGFDECDFGDSEDENSDADTENENTCFECEEKSSKIQALEIECADAKIKLGTENPSMKKALEKSKEELVKLENQLETEAASKKMLEESLSSYRKLRQSWAVKVYQSNPSNEDLDRLLSLEPETLFKKYEQIMKEQSSDRIKLEETTETLKDLKIKLILQTVQKRSFEKQLSEIREVLHLPDENCNFANILPVVKDLLEQNEINHCSNGLSMVESSSSQI